MKVPYLDLSVNDKNLKKDLLAAVDQVLSHGRVVLGPEITEFENLIAEMCNRKYAVGVSSGTDALYVSLRSLGIGPGDEVITTPMSWIATVNAIVLTGAQPVFVDIRSDLNINPERIVEVITPCTKAILPVHYTGKICDMEAIGDIANEYGLLVIEDAAQAFAAKNSYGIAGSFGKVACFSMNAMKVLHSYGEAGVVVTDDENIKEKMVSLRYAGTVNREDCVIPSLNFRIHTLQAALLLVELKRIDKIISQRRRIAAHYEGLLRDVVVCPHEDTGSESVYYTYTIQVDHRDELRDFMANSNIETKIHHPILMPYHTAYNGCFPTDIPVAERAVQRILSIPNHENMTDDEVDYVASTILHFYSNKIA
jgi:dTDP-4-amino-4,6-dideoxygalactose transaminase